MAPRIAEQVPEYAMQMVAVELNPESWRHAQVKHARRNAFGLPDLVNHTAHESIKLKQFRLSPVTPIQLQDLLHNAVQASSIVTNNAGQASVTWFAAGLLGQQLRRVPDGRQRIAYFVGDVRCQAAQGSQLHLLRLYPQLASIFQKYQQLATGLASCDQQSRVHPMTGNIKLRPATPFACSPAAGGLVERGSEIGEALAVHALASQQSFRLRVREPDRPLRVDHQNTARHVANDKPIDLDLVAQVFRALPDQRFVGDQAFRQPVCDQCYGKATARQQANRKIVSPSYFILQHPIGVLHEQGECGERGIKEGGPSSRHRRRGRQRHE